MKAIILAGGSGTRLWPLSRKSYPKQFLKLNSNTSLLQQSVDRLSGYLQMEDVLIITNKEYMFYVKSELKNMTEGGHKAHVLYEPTGRNTAPAILLGIKYCEEIIGVNDDEIMFICPSDHVIKPNGKFIDYLKNAEIAAKNGYIVTFGITPVRPETGYGYIERGDKLNGLSASMECFLVRAFTEKPNTDTAKQYIDGGNHFWNSGMFTFQIGVMKEELKKYVPNLWQYYDLKYNEFIEQFAQIPDKSIDYAVMEKTDKIAVLPMDIYWNDIGSWDSVYEILEQDTDGNSTTGNVITLETKGSMIIGGKRLMATIGLEDCLIVETDDAILVSKRGQAQKVKDMVTYLKEQNKKEVSEHTTMYKPWGHFTVLEEGNRFKIKQVVVIPGEALSLQMHHHRSEHWIIVAGTAKVTIADKEMFVHENESVYVPKSTKHRLENPGKIPLALIEVQNGEYLEEDDIIRYDDKYARLI
ncbi:MAG: mannose-1-phosphate guanylyltransferase/mannose-6-phosphate isomerase [Candidatus Magnetoovum sp. WYHC-5]|nr:mannose-1-phosphate guanylyltransferase/mannose-6-phosphate isomerase [Candidatus Magnetoovum sp. WYHC-5]